MTGLLSLCDDVAMNTQEKLTKLAALQKKRRQVEHDLDQLVLELRSPDLSGHCEASWQEVGQALGVSKQAAHQMYRRGAL